MKSIFTIKLHKSFLVLIIFVLSIYNFCYAEDEISTTNASSGITFLGETSEMEEEHLLKKGFTIRETTYTENHAGGYFIEDTHFEIDKNKYKGYYKNWIIDLGEVKMTFYNSSGTMLKSVNILPTQFAGVSSILVNKDFVEGDYEVILRGTKPDGINVSGKFFSNNIPLMQEYRMNLTYIKYDKWEGAKTFTDWSTDSNNLFLLLKDIGMSEDGIFEGKDVLTWLQTGGSIIMEPVSYYPLSVQEIETNVSPAQKEYGFNYNATAFLDSISLVFDKDLTEAEKKDLKNGKYTGENPKLLQWLGYAIYFHCGFKRSTETIPVRHYLAIGDKYEGQRASLTEKWKSIVNGIEAELNSVGVEFAGLVAGEIAADLGGEEHREKAEEIGRKLAEEISKKVSHVVKTEYLTYGIDLATGNISSLTNDVMDTAIDVKIKNEILKGVHSILDSSLFAKLGIDSQTKIIYNGESITIEKYFDNILKDLIIIHLLAGLKEFKEEIIEGINKIGHKIGEKFNFLYDEELDAYYFETTEYICNTHFVGLTYTETTEYSQEWAKNHGFFEGIEDFFIGTKNRITIDTDHNKYSIVIPKSKDEKAKEMQQVLVGGGVLKDEDPMRYGSAMICGQTVLGDEILIKFHSNLEQISDSTGYIDEQYNLYAQIGSNEYTWQKDGTKVTKFPYTYPQDIASAYKNDEGESYE